MLLMGESGAGKSTIVEYWLRQNPERETPDGIIRPVLLVEVPEHTTKRALVNSIWESLGFASERMTAEDMIRSIALKVQLLGVQLIILDEAHHILQGKELLAVSEFLKSLLNRIGAGMVFVGLPSIKAIADMSKQFDRRLMPDVELRPYNWTLKAERLEFLMLLATMEKAMNLPEESDLQDQRIARRLYSATRGEIGLVTKYLSQALLSARRKGMTRISLDLLAEVDANWHPVSKKNQDIPFDDDLDFVDDAEIAGLAANAGRPQIDKNTNPFACDPKNLLDILQMRRAQPDRYVMADPRVSGRRGVGKGPAEPKAFG